jgi:hypothetical protein
MTNPLQNLHTLPLTPHMLKNKLTPLHRSRLILFTSDKQERCPNRRIIRDLRTRNSATESRIPLGILTEKEFSNEGPLERGAAGSDGGGGDGVGHWFHSGYRKALRVSIACRIIP